MQAIVLAEPGRLQVAQRAQPQSPPPGHALVRVRRVGVCGTDIHAFHGRQPFFSYPRVLGHELGVEIQEVNAPTSSQPPLQPGDICAVEPYLHCARCRACQRGKPNCCQHLQVLGVHADGGMLSHLILPIEKLHPAPGLSFDQAALVETLAIGCHAVERSRPSEWPSQVRVLVIGAGPIGLAVLQFVLLHITKRAAGRALDGGWDQAQVSVLDTSLERRAFCRDKIGIHSTLSIEEAQDQKFDVVFDATGNSASMSGAFERVEHGGTLVFVGLFPGDISFHDPLLHKCEITLLASRNALPGDFSFIIQSIAHGQLDTTPWITHRASFSDFPHAFGLWLLPSSGLVKGIIEVDS